MRLAGYSRRKSLSKSACPVLPSVVVVTQCSYAKIIAYRLNSVCRGMLASEWHCAANADAAPRQNTTGRSGKTVAKHGCRVHPQTGYKEPALQLENAQR